MKIIKTIHFSFGNEKFQLIVVDQNIYNTTTIDNHDNTNNNIDSDNNIDSNNNNDINDDTVNNENDYDIPNFDFTKRTF